MDAFANRSYRCSYTAEDLVYFRVTVAQSDLYIAASEDLSSLALERLKLYRRQIEDYILKDKRFEESFAPVRVDSIVPIVRLMAEAARRAGVGPMAAVAGAIARMVGQDLAKVTPEVIVENGGDIFIHSAKQRTVGVFAGTSPLSGRLAVRLPAGTWGLCTSAGTIGHSHSAGKADAAAVLAHDAAFADAMATALGNAVKKPQDIQQALDSAAAVQGVEGALIIIGEHIGFFGLDMQPLQDTKK